MGGVKIKKCLSERKILVFGFFSTCENLVLGHRIRLSVPTLSLRVVSFWFFVYN